MKKIFYSNYTKFAAFMLCVLSVAYGVYLVSSCFIKDNNVYLFEGSYNESYGAREAKYHEFLSLKNKLERTIDENGKLHPEEIVGFPKAEEWEYYIRVNDKIYTNVSGEDVVKNVPPANVKGIDYDEFEHSIVAMGFTQKGKSGQWDFFSTPNNSDALYMSLDTVDDFDLCIRMNEDVLVKNLQAWSAMENTAENAARRIVVLIVIATVMGVYLLFAAGRKKGTEEIQMLLIDRVFVEIMLGVLAAVSIGGIAAVVNLMEYLLDSAAEGAAYAISLAAAATAALVLTIILSIVRNLKNRTFLERSIIFRVCRFLWRTIKKICCWCVKMLAEAKKTIMEASATSFGGKYIGIVIVGYSIAVILLSHIGYIFGILLIPFVIWAVVFAAKRVAGLEKLKNGIEKIKNGDLDHKIEDCPDGFVGKMAEDVNSIGEGLQKSLERSIKSERMKTELITNVSHDLKTPLTSIINYSDLLSKETLTPAEANDYVAIIASKSARLKQLTEDLFDISKVQSGNEEFNIESLDICLLIDQAMAEMNDTRPDLMFRFSHKSKEAFVLADGRKMSRVFENLFSNCLKYAMQNTRVYIDVSENENTISVEIKNIAGYEMDFDDEEITERFTRGDSSRNSEGSGLGLAIVKSYVEGCGGQLKVHTDGDLFKVTIVLERA